MVRYSSARIEGVSAGGVVGKRGERSGMFRMAARVASTFVEETNVGGGCAEEYVPDGSGESIVGWGRGDEMSVL